jgi:MFS-type transporter involved in bile tolerance (Atg22 family)
MARHAKKERMGSFSELLGDPRWRARAVCGALLAMVGLATFWGAVVAGQDIAADFLKRANDPDWASKSKIAFGFIQTAGAGVGMLAFGPLAARWGCKKTFFIMHLAALVMTFAVCWLPSYFASYVLLLFLLPLFGFFSQGIHASYAVYFPALFPTHLRATGSGFCFNTGRLLAAPVLIWLSAWMKSTMDLRLAITCLSGFFLLGLVFLALLPETRGEELPE